MEDLPGAANAASRAVTYQEVLDYVTAHRTAAFETTATRLWRAMMLARCAMTGERFVVNVKTEWRPTVTELRTLDADRFKDERVTRLRSHDLTLVLNFIASLQH